MVQAGLELHMSQKRTCFHLLIAGVADGCHHVCCVQCWGSGPAPYAHQASTLAAELQAVELVLQQWGWT